MSTLPLITPMQLTRAKQPFEGNEWIFELKHDGFRALAYIENGKCRLISRKGHEFKGFHALCNGIASKIKVRNAIIDGEICCLGEDGRSVFNMLLFRRGPFFFYAFDLLWLNGRDLRKWPLLRRKERLRKLIPKPPSPILYTGHLDGQGVELFLAACEHDLEGIVAKRKDSVYDEAQGRSSSWVKIKNPAYSQAKGRSDLFQRKSS